jgi:hypothetical protein
MKLDIHVSLMKLNSNQLTNMKLLGENQTNASGHCNGTVFFQEDFKSMWNESRNRQMGLYLSKKPLQSKVYSAMTTYRLERKYLLCIHM